jgi:hypothetical protein
VQRSYVAPTVNRKHASIEDEDDDEYEDDHRIALYHSRPSYAIFPPVIPNRVSHTVISVPDSLAASCKLEASVSLSRS